MTGGLHLASPEATCGLLMNPTLFREEQNFFVRLIKSALLLEDRDPPTLDLCKNPHLRAQGIFHPKPN